jgi:fatty acid kinase fatty acid binding subunit
MSKVGLVADSTCDLTPEWLAAHDIAMVPLTVLFGSESFLDWVELRPDQFYEKLASFPGLPKTSQPSPAAFTEAYEKAAEAGCEEIVSIHLSGPLSGTMQSATLAAATAPVPVHVIDTHKVTQGVALPIIEAMNARDAGASGEEVAEVARRAAARTRLFFLLDTLDYLVKGGRAGKAQALAASLLNIKPVLEVNSDGIIEPFKKVRGERQAIQALVDTVVEDAAKLGHLKLGLLHACHPDRMATLKQLILDSGADVEMVTEGTIGAVIGTYAGPGALGVTYLPAHA